MSAMVAARPELVEEAGGRGGGDMGPASNSIVEEEGERAGGGVLACRAWIILCVATRFSTWERVRPVGDARSRSHHSSSLIGASSGTFERDWEHREE